MVPPPPQPAPHLGRQEAPERADRGAQQVRARARGDAQRDRIEQDRVLRVGLVGGRRARGLAAGREDDLERVAQRAARAVVVGQRQRLQQAQALGLFVSSLLFGEVGLP